MRSGITSQAAAVLGLVLLSAVAGVWFERHVLSQVSAQSARFQQANQRAMEPANALAAARGEHEVYRIALPSIPRSGNGWIRGMIEAATGVATATVYPGGNVLNPRPGRCSVFPSPPLNRCAMRCALSYCVTGAIC